MGLLFGILKFGFRRSLEIFLITLMIVFVPWFPPKATFNQSFTVSPSKPLSGKLSLNNKLDNVENWHKGDLFGPETFADWNGEIYTGLYSGDIVKLSGNHITPVVKFGKPCHETYEESICGRPLGMAFNKDGVLYAADAYYGIFKVDVKTGKKELLVGPNAKINGRKAKLFNSVALAENGDIFWTDSASDFSLQDGIYTMLADPSGRLIHYDAKTKQNRVLIENIFFANGVALSENEEFVVVAETGQSRLLRYHLKGTKKGQSDVFIDGLPGLPDNLKQDGKGGFLVPLVMAKDEEHPVLFQSITPFPLVRKAVARFMGVTEYIFDKIDQYYPNEFSRKTVYFIGHFTSLPKWFSSPRVSLLRVNKDGVVTDSVHTMKGKLAAISEMHIVKDTLYLGSPWEDYVGRIPLSKLGWDDLRREERAKRAAPEAAPTTTQKPTTTTTTTPKPTTTTPKPTTTTPKPTTTTPKPTTTTQKPTTTTTTPKPTTTTQKATTTTTKPTTTTPKPGTTTQRATTTTTKPTTTTTKPTPTTPKPTTTTHTPPTNKKPVPTTEKPATKKDLPKNPTKPVKN